MLKSSITYSQGITLDKRGDTLICFTTPQSKFLLKTYYELQECKNLDSIAIKQNQTLKNLIAIKDKQISEQKELTAKTEHQVAINKDAVDSMISVVNDQNKSIKKLQVKNYILSVVGATGTLVMTILYLGQLIKN